MTIAEQIQASPLFKGVPLSDLEALVAAMQTASYPAQTTLFRKGDPGDTMFIILSGKLRIFTYDADGHELTLTHYGPGRIFGDFSLLDQQPRSASAITEEPLEVLYLQRAAFMILLPKYPSIGL